MPLTDEQKIKIIEEEKYRMSLVDGNQSSYKSKKGGLGCGTIAIFVILLFVVLSVAMLVWQKPSELAKKSEQQKEKQVNTIKEGKFLKYDYVILKSDDSTKYSATFNPFLPRNDGVVTSAILELINQTYGKHTVKNLQPQLVEKNGVNVILIGGVNTNYYFLPVKEDTGEVHSFVFWSE